MMDFLLSAMPGMMAKYEYARDLLKWADQSFSKIKAHPTTAGYPRMNPLLLSSLLCP
jgi:hypothetical protein